MASEQPVPHIQAMVMCRDSEQDDGGTWNLYGVFRETASLRYPARLTFEIFVQYTNAVGVYRFESRLLDLLTGTTLPIPARLSQ